MPIAQRIQSSNPVAVWGEGPVPSPYMVVGEAPGRNEIEQGKPFCGRSGDLLDAALEYAGLARGAAFVTNAYKGDVGSGNRNPTSAEILDHRPYLLDELAAVQPRGILLLGRIAAEAFGLEFGRLGDIVGRRLGGASEVPLYPSYHPAYVLRGGYSQEEFKYDVARFVLITRVLYDNNQRLRSEDGVRLWNGERYHRR